MTRANRKRGAQEARTRMAVSYTNLTLPTKA